MVCMRTKLTLGWRSTGACCARAEQLRPVALTSLETCNANDRSESAAACVYSLGEIVVGLQPSAWQLDGLTRILACRAMCILSRIKAPLRFRMRFRRFEDL